MYVDVSLHCRKWIVTKIDYKRLSKQIHFLMSNAVWIYPMYMYHVGPLVLDEGVGRHLDVSC